LYRLIFIKLYRTACWINKNEFPEWKSILLLSMIIGVNIFLVLKFLTSFPNTLIYRYSLNNPWYVIPIFFVIISINYYRFIRGEKFLKYNEQHNGKGLKALAENIFVIIYIGLSPMILF